MSCPGLKSPRQAPLVGAFFYSLEHYDVGDEYGWRKLRELGAIRNRPSTFAKFVTDMITPQAHYLQMPI